jgi:large subunit ribosomal protein L18
MNAKKQARLRRGAKARRRQREINVPRLCVHKTPRHIYAQLIDANNMVLTCASTLDKEIRSTLSGQNGVGAATIVGKKIGERASKIGCVKVAFDRSGFKYHGRIKALADGAREAGLEF